MEDEKIVALYWSRDEAAIHETQGKYERYLTRIAYNILSNLDDSMESVNDTYLAAWNSIPPNKPSVLSTYLGKLTRRISIDIFRKRSREKRQGAQYAVSLTELADCIPDTNTPEPEQTVAVQVLADAINKYLHTLPEEARNTFVGRYYFLDSVKSVAGYCGMSESKAKSMLYRTRCGLKEYLIKEGFAL